MEDFHFALGAVGDMETDRAVVQKINSGPDVAGFVERAQLEDIVLQLVEDCGRLDVAEQVDTTVAER